MTPELASGTTKAGVRYYVTAQGTTGHFPGAVGHLYTETEIRSLDSDNKVRAIDDPEYDYREEVAQLYNGSLWYHLWVEDGAGDPLVVMGGAAEGALRDYRGRVFGIKELPDGAVDVQELYSIHSSQPTVYDTATRYVQLKPMAQDANGYIYFRGSQTDHGVYKTRLTWNDNPHLHQ